MSADGGALSSSGERRGGIPGTRRYEKPGGGAAAGGDGGAGKGDLVGQAKTAASRLRPLDGVIAGLFLGLVATFILPSHWASVRAANEASAQAFTQEIARLQETFKAQKGGGRKFASGLFELASSGVYQGEAPEGGILVRSGYTFRVNTLDNEGLRWYAVATPQLLHGTGDRSFYVDDTGKVRVSNGTVVGPAFPEVQ